MASNSETQPDHNTEQGAYQGYSDYKSVTNQVASSVEQAIQAYAELEGLHQEHKGPNRKRAAYARRDILSAAMRLLPELRENEHIADNGSSFAEIIDRWEDSGMDDVGPFMDEFRTVRLTNGLPQWVHQFVMDIQTAAWEIGYLRAGRYEEKEVESETEQAARAMVEDILGAK